jgi:Carbohydrate-selective porin, OprB family
LHPWGIRWQRGIDDAGLRGPEVVDPEMLHFVFADLNLDRDLGDHIRGLVLQVNPKVRAQRYFFKQTFGLGGEQEDVADAANQLPGKRDIDRITVIIGRFAVGDFFDGNSYAKDPRADFMNWAMWSSAAYDFPPTCRDIRGVPLSNSIERTGQCVRAISRCPPFDRIGSSRAPSSTVSDLLVRFSKRSRILHAVS